MVAGGDASMAVQWLTSKPAEVMGWQDAGRLVMGGTADLTIFDPEEEWVFTAEESKSKSKNSPFIGKNFCGRVRYTFVDGRLVYAR
jgi:dihydroorotase